jgi:hypothetical protein
MSSMKTIKGLIFAGLFGLTGMLAGCGGGGAGRHNYYNYYNRPICGHFATGHFIGIGAI